jgi:hypothetical protein
MRTRRRTDDDFEHGILRDGHVARVSMLARDGDDSPHWNEARDRRRKQTRKFDPKGRLISTSEEEEEMEDAIPRRPGFTRDALDRIEQAYREAELRDASAWRHLGRHDEADGMTSDRWGGKVGAECTINGAPGHLKMVNGGLQCVPDAKDAMPELTGDAALDAALVIAANISDPVERAYAECAARDEHAWKRPL